MIPTPRHRTRIHSCMLAMRRCGVNARFTCQARLSLSEVSNADASSLNSSTGVSFTASWTVCTKLQELGYSLLERRGKQEKFRRCLLLPALLPALLRWVALLIKIPACCACQAARQQGMAPILSAALQVIRLASLRGGIITELTAAAQPTAALPSEALQCAGTLDRCN